MSCSRFKGVRPAACISPTRGSDILPSDRTGIERCETSGSFQTLIVRISSLPITKLASCGLLAETSELCPAGDAGAEAEDPACAHNQVDMSGQTNSRPSHFIPRLFFMWTPFIQFGLFSLSLSCRCPQNHYRLFWCHFHPRRVRHRRR